VYSLRKRARIALVARPVRLIALALALLAGGAVIQRTRSAAERHFLATQRYEDVYYLPPPIWLRVLSLGHREALADMLWLRSLLYFTDELHHRGEVKHLYDYTDAMLGLDEHFKKVYLWVSSCALYRTGTVTDRDARKAIEYLERAVRLFPDDGELAWTLGATYSYELVPLLEDENAQLEAKRRGLEHLTVAALRGAGPPWLALSAASELRRLGHTEKEIAHLQEVYAQVSDPSVKAEVEARIAELQTAAYAEALKRTDQQLEAQRQRDFPYLDRGLHLLVGSKPPFDGTALRLRNFDPEPDPFADAEFATAYTEP
jgi:tetratricopeptide (TPR) repeat protein